ncbi:MAG: single-stranded DNA-binding protein [Candidatus Margulisiibacteriota bacterium]|jgi:single-strand DNA-binding protein
MSNLNRIILIGRVSSEVELRYTMEGSALAKFQLAIDRPKSKDGVQKTDFINIVAWNKLAEICAEYLKKGRLTLVEGRAQQRSFEVEDKKKYVTEVIAQNMRMLDGLAAVPEQSFKHEVAASVTQPNEEAESAKYKMSSEPDYAVAAPDESAPSGSEPFYTEDDIPF